jgi:hypothetical protein
LFCFWGLIQHATGSAAGSSAHPSSAHFGAYTVYVYIKAASAAAAAQCVMCTINKGVVYVQLNTAERIKADDAGLLLFIVVCPLQPE